MKKYKLTEQNLITRAKYFNETHWEIGVWQRELSGDGGLCDKGFYHYYHHPLLAVLFNPIHAEIRNPRLFEVEAKGKHMDDNGIKGGCTKMRLVRESDIPAVTTTQRIAFAILCAKEVCKNADWNRWADNWLNGVDRTADAANAAANAANAAANAAYAADAAAYAANAAAYAAYAADAAAYAAPAAAYAAAYAADAANWDYKKLVQIAEKAMLCK